MTLMAGFDLVAEISNETIRKLLINNLLIGGVPANPPFELNLPVSGGGASGVAHLIVTDLQVDLNANDTITLSLSFNRTSVLTTAPLALNICPLDGIITITAALQLVNTTGSSKQVSVNLGAATVAISWSAAANQEITHDLTGTFVTPAMFNTLAVQALTAYVQSVPSPSIPLAFKVVSGSNGTLSPELQFEKLEVHSIFNAIRSKQALGIFGILLVANHAHGNHAQKTSTAITAAHDGVCISIAPGAFHSLIFCPAIATALGTDAANLPGTCGNASGYDTQGVTVNSVSDDFANGHIDINGAVSKSGFCYDASGTFHGTITFAISGATLQPNLNMDDPDVNVDIPWYCYIVAGVVLGPIGLVLAGVADAVADSVADSLAGDALKNALGGGIPGASLGGLSGASFNGVSVTTEGITMQGTVPLSTSHPFVMPMIELSGSVIDSQKTAVDSGIFHAKIWCMADAKDYPYTEYSQQQKGTYTLTGTLVSQPLTPVFTIDAGNGSAAIPLTGANGTIAVPNVTTHYPMPLATGGTAMQQTVHVGYSINGATVQLTNIPSEGNYRIYLNVSANDCNGNPVLDDVQHTLSTFILVQFEGDHVELGNGYADDVQYCAQLLKEWMQRILNEYRPYKKVPIWEQVNYPAPEDLIQYIRDVFALDIPQADAILMSSKIAHGNSFYRAFFSPAARKPALLKVNAGREAAKQQLANLAKELAGISQRLTSEGGISEKAGLDSVVSGKGI